LVTFIQSWCGNTHILQPLVMKRFIVGLQQTVLVLGLLQSLTFGGRRNVVTVVMMIVATGAPLQGSSACLGPKVQFTACKSHKNIINLIQLLGISNYVSQFGVH